jgi:hypothetical protein
MCTQLIVSGHIEQAIANVTGHKNGRMARARRHVPLLVVPSIIYRHFSPGGE